MFAAPNLIFTASQKKTLSATYLVIGGGGGGGGGNGGGAGGFLTASGFDFFTALITA